MWMIFIGDLRRRWVEYALGAAAVALVVAALVTHRAVTASAEESVHELAHRLGQNMLVVPAASDLGAFCAQRYGPESLPDGLPVAGVMPSTGSGEDVALLMRIDGLQAHSGVDGANALRLFLRAGVSPQDAEARLARAGVDAAVIRSDRGDVADRETQESLSRHRGVAYAVMAVVAGLCLLMAAHLDAAERRVELATLVAIGASRWTVLGAILARSSLVAVVGAVIGAAAGAGLAVGQDPALAPVVASAWHVSATTVAAALGLGILAAAPTAFVCSARDPVRELQEG